MCCVCIYIYIYIYIYDVTLSIYMLVCCVCMYVCIYIYACVCVYVYACLNYIYFCMITKSIEYRYVLLSCSLFCFCFFVIEIISETYINNLSPGLVVRARFF